MQCSTIKRCQPGISHDKFDEQSVKGTNVEINNRSFFTLSDPFTRAIFAANLCEIFFFGRM